jgi:peptidoglycan/LPS O-acetylase OafA/YrhL
MVFIVFIERKAAKNYVYNGVTDTSEWVVLSYIVLAGSICIAALSWRFLESPVLQYARKAPHLSRK